MNKILYGLILGLLVISISDCSSHKNNEKLTQGANNDSSIENNGKNVSYEEQERLHLQEIRKNNVVYFDLDKYNISSEYLPMLDKHSAFLCQHPSCKVTIEGHADERGTSEYNIALGERRANAVKMYLQSKGVMTEQMSIVSYGKEKPAILGHNEAAYTKNRRSVLVLIACERSTA
ncbi:Peptidoglycan-associated lipoprotein [Candidatus Profftia lariciata]|nr:Peptidoglycan-associated lipoprotein [Candidatus Profftia lariciata]